MAESDFDRSGNNGGDGKSQRLADRLATIDPKSVEAMNNAETSQENDQTPRVPRSHLVNPPGQMVIGSRVPAPKLTPAEMSNALKRQYLFSSSNEAPRRGISGGAAVFLACALAAGTTVGVTSLLQDGSGSGVQAAGHVDDPAQGEAVTLSDLDPEEAAATLAASVLPVAEDGKPAETRVAQASVGGLVVRDVSVKAGEEIPIDISVNQGNSGEYAFLMFRGLSDEFALSAGFRLKDSWAVSLQDVKGLRLLPPEGYSGDLNLEVLLVKGRNTPVVSGTMHVAVEPDRPQVQPIEAPTAVAAAEPAPSEAVAPSEPAPVPTILTAAPATPEPQEIQQQREATVAYADPVEPVAPKLKISEEEELQMLERAFDLLGGGDIVSARLLLEHLAKKGSGKGAMALGQTYDPTFFNSMNTLGGPQPDSSQARKWYAMAVQLGQEGAQDRLGALPPN